MDVLLLNDEFPPLGGGAANACRYLLEEMAELDINIDLVTSSPSRRFECEKIGQSIIVYKLAVAKRNIHSWTRREILTYSWRARGFIQKLLRAKRYDLCHAFFGVPCGAIAYLFRKEMPYIVSLRGSDVPGFNPRFSLLYVFLKPVIRKVWRDAEAVIANSDGLRELAYETDPECQMDVIFNGVDTDQFRRASDKENKNVLRILCVSRLIRRKNIHNLLRSLPQLRARFGAIFEVWVVGEGPQEAELRGIAEQFGVADMVTFKGYVRHSSLPDIYSNSDIFVLPSMNEGMSNAVLEAMACGLPIVTTDTGGTRELIRGNGLVIPRGDPAVIANAIGELMENPLLRTRMGERSAKLAAQFTWRAAAEGYQEIYEKICHVGRVSRPDT